MAAAPISPRPRLSPVMSAQQQVGQAKGEVLYSQAVGIELGPRVLPGVGVEVVAVDNADEIAA